MPRGSLTFRLAVPGTFTEDLLDHERVDMVTYKTLRWFFTHDNHRWPRCGRT